MGESELIVFIYLPGETVAVPAGVFRHDADAGIGTFVYGRRYVERPDALGVDPVALPLGSPPREVTSNEGLYGALRDAAPDYWGRMVIAAERQTAPEALSELDFLAASDATRVGNLDFRLSPDAPEPTVGPPQLSRLADIAAGAGGIERGQDVPGHLLRLLRQGTSVGGARPKCTVELDGALWIAKLPARGDTVNVPRIEYATMTLAARCGIDTPEVRLVQGAGKDVLLVRRFDREEGNGGWLRHGFLSSLSFMRWDQRDRVRWDYVALADAMRRHTSAADIAALFRRMVFNILVRNTDDHPRNHGFLVEGHEISLSPAYDIVPSSVQSGVGTEFRLAMSVGDRGRDADLGNALSRAARFGLSAARAATLVDELLTEARLWREHFEECGVPERERELLAPSMDRSDWRL